MIKGYIEKKNFNNYIVIKVVCSRRFLLLFLRSSIKLHLPEVFVVCFFLKYKRVIKKIY